MPSHDAMNTAQHQPVELRSISLHLKGGNDQDTDDDEDAEDRRAAVLAEEYSGTRNAKMSTEEQSYLNELNRRTLKKLDTVLLPFLALLFLFNSLDRSNIGNAETANFTADIGLRPEDLNTAVAVFFVFFVALQPVGAALGRKYGMARWVPACMTIWGICTALHIWVRSKWQLIVLRMVIGALEAGFYPVTVSYLSLFYTRYEFARRLGLFYGQYAMAGALGGLLSYAIFSRFPRLPDGSQTSDGWRSWEILFLVEGGSTVILAIVGFFWLPHNAKTAWFLAPDERVWAEQRIAQDLVAAAAPMYNSSHQQPAPGDEENDPHGPTSDETLGLLSTEPTAVPSVEPAVAGGRAATDDRGLSKADILEAAFDWKLWWLLVCNILSSIPVTAFSVFLPIVLQPLATSPANANLLTAPPFLFGAVVLYAFTHWSDKSRQRLVPILVGLGLLLLGLTGVVAVPDDWAGVRYASLCVLLGGTFVASPLTIAWFTGNTPETGKRSVILGINGWGNLAGVISSLIYQPSFAPTYRVPFFITLALVLISFTGYAYFRVLLIRENRARKALLESWSETEVEAEQRFGRGPLLDRQRRGPATGVGRLLAGYGRGLSQTDGGRRGDSRITFRYGL